MQQKKQARVVERDKRSTHLTAAQFPIEKYYAIRRFEPGWILIEVHTQGHLIVKKVNHTLDADTKEMAINKAMRLLIQSDLPYRAEDE